MDVYGRGGNRILNLKVQLPNEAGKSSTVLPDMYEANKIHLPTGTYWSPFSIVYTFIRFQ